MSPSTPQPPATGYLMTPPLALAHRGGSTYGPTAGLENTKRAFAAAVELGYVYLETDVHVTADGVLVAAHDETLERVSDGRGAIADLPWQVVSAAKVGGREPIPTMRELLSAFPEARFNIDLKAPGAVEPMAALIDELGAHARVCIGSFSPATLRAFRRRMADSRRAHPGRPVTATSAGQLGTAAARLLPWWISRWVHTPGVAFQVPVRHRIGPITVEVVTSEFVETAHRLGKQVHVWTIDDPVEMERLLDLGVDGIVTDAIDVLRDVLAKRGVTLGAQP